MEFENYILCLRNQRHASEAEIRSVRRVFARFSSFLVSESITDLRVVNADLLHCYAETLSDLTIPSLYHQLSILCSYIEYVATLWQQEPGSIHSQSYPRSFYIPSLEDIRRLIEVAARDKRTRSVGH